MEHRYPKPASRRTKIRRSVYERVAARRAERGFARTLPRVWAPEE